ncbi:MAG: hypothetical protein FJY81_01790 [Candidatus Aminicenantes bacterium]|nr:hypothetical protein [Candidatus Aminicenantes bacterium]
MRKEAKEMKTKRSIPGLLPAVFILIIPIFFIVSIDLVRGEDRPTLDASLLKNFSFRNLGPFRCGSWVTGFAVPDTPPKAHLYTFYVATRNGGVWKTTTNGTTFEPVFDDQQYLSIGAIAVAPSNPDIVWVGTGEAYNARSSHCGDGVYKSTDAGKTWKNMGLRDSHHVARIVIHPGNPDVVYVAAMGHLFSFNEERGVFKTTDGGATWEKVLYINEKVGVIDLAMNLKNPDILYAATYEKYRYPWHFEESGPESGIYKTLDGGKTWERLSGGLPPGKIGRIGLDLYRKNPDIIYAVVENANLRPPTEEEAKEDRRRGLEPQPRAIAGEVYRSEDGGETWKKMNSDRDDVSGKAAYSFNQICVDPNDDQKVYIIGIALAYSYDGGKTWKNLGWPPTLFASAFGDVRTFWIDPENSDRMLFGSDGGVYISYDGGKTCDHLYNIPLGEFYAIGVDMEEPYNIYGGLQDHDSWKGPSNAWSGEVTLEDWVTVGIQDGMYNVADPEDSRWVYNTFQFGGHGRVDQKLGTRTNIQPVREKEKPPYRFNWTPPIHISPHNSRIIYTGAQVLLRSLNRGDTWQEISLDLTLNDPEKIAGRGHITFCTITTIAESPLQPGLIWVGTDDGKVWLTRDGGANWSDVTASLSRTGAPADRWVSRVFASHHSPATAYVTKTGFRNDDFRPFVYKTEDYGTTWKDISSGLPEFPVNVIFEDRKNPGLLFVGSDGGVFVSIDGGAKWVRLKNNLPSAPVKDLLVHPRENDLVVGTYGRGIFVTDISPLQEFNAKVLAEDVYLFEVEPRIQWVTRAWGNYRLMGDRHLATPNEPNAVAINYYLREKSRDKIKIIVSDPYGKVLRELEGKNEPGLNTVLWDMRATPPEDATPEREWARRHGPLVEPGEVVVTLETAGKKLSRKALIKGRRGWNVGPRTVPIE